MPKQKYKVGLAQLEPNWIQNKSQGTLLDINVTSLRYKTLQ